MAHRASRMAWRPPHDLDRPRRSSPWLALLFNLCLLAAPLAGAFAFAIIEHDGLYAYSVNANVTRAVRRQVELLAGEMILLDFDRRRQWDDLVALELIDGDVPAARGVLLSARAMVAPNDAAQFGASLSGSDDAALELAALELLTPGTRGRYEALVPLLSRRSATGVSRREADAFSVLGDERDFELLSRAMLEDAQSDQIQFTLTGLGLGLGGELSPSAREGASILIAATRRDDFPPELRAQFADRLERALSLNSFRAGAAAAGDDAATYEISAAAFREAAAPQALAVVVADLEQIGALGDAVTPGGAALVLAHARNLNDLPRLRLVGEAAGDRTVAVAKRLARDGRLPRAARGLLTFNRELIIALAAFGVALAIAAAVAGLEAYRALRDALARLRPTPAHDDNDNDDDDALYQHAPSTKEPDLVRSFGNGRRAI